MEAAEAMVAGMGSVSSGLRNWSSLVRTLKHL